MMHMGKLILNTFLPRDHSQCAVMPQYVVPLVRLIVLSICLTLR